VLSKYNIWENSEEGKQNYLETSLFQYHIFHHISHIDWPGTDPGNSLSEPWHKSGIECKELLRPDVLTNFPYLMTIRQTGSKIGRIFSQQYLWLPVSVAARSKAARLLKLWVRIPPGAWMFVCCTCCESGRDLCDELITPPEESYRLWCVVVCDLEISWMRRPCPTGGLLCQKQTYKQYD